MEIGQSIVSTEEYIRLREIQQKYNNIKDEMEEKADKIVVQGFLEKITHRFIGKDEALGMMQKTIDTISKSIAAKDIEINTLNAIIKSLPGAPVPSTSIIARIKFLFTGRPVYESGK